MYISRRGSLVKNVATAVVNGAISLVILLIAPLGLAAVIMNTFVITVSTFIVGIGFDHLSFWLLKGSKRQYFDYPLENQNIQSFSQRRHGDITRRQDW